MKYFSSNINATLVTINNKYICYIGIITESILHTRNIVFQKYQYKINNSFTLKNFEMKSRNFREISNEMVKYFLKSSVC